MTTPREEIPPDTKDWTWVLTRRCPECGLAAGEVPLGQVPALVRSHIPRWAAVLARPEARRRPSPTVWSATEYAAHVRDVHRLFAERLALLLTRDCPTFPDWDQDAAARSGGYADLAPSQVAVELAAAAEASAAAFEAVHPQQAARRGLRSNGSEFTVTTLAQYYWHDVHHHLVDVAG